VEIIRAYKAECRGCAWVRTAEQKAEAGDRQTERGARRKGERVPSEAGNTEYLERKGTLQVLVQIGVDEYGCTCTAAAETSFHAMA
jgi:hypothetical protein